MEKSERWPMYFKIQELKSLGLKVSQIARHIGVSRNTIYKYIDLTPDEFNKYLVEVEKRRKKLDKYHKKILQWLKDYPDISAAQIHDWLEERQENIAITQGTVRNYVNDLREVYNIPKQLIKREFEGIEDPPIGHQAQVDFGEIRLADRNSNLIRLYVITFVLSHSRYKYAEWLDRPFTTSDVIRCQENAFSYYGGMPEEMVYDQDSLILVSENHGDLILTKEFASYHKKRKFKIHMCRKADPQSKGRVEKVVDFVKSNFAKHRTFYNLDKFNELCLTWLERRGNGKKHNTTKKIPAEVFALERQHLKPVETKIDTLKPITNIVTRVVRKDNTIVYLSNRYSLPLETYNKIQGDVALTITAEEALLITDPDTGEFIAEHPLCHEKGKLIKDGSHTRDKSKGIDAFMEQVARMLGNSPEALGFLEQIRTEKGRYIRDQLQLIKQHVLDVDEVLVSEALNYCLKNSLTSANDFKDALEYFQDKRSFSKKCNTELPCEDKPLYEDDFVTRKIKPEKRDIKVYQEIMNGGCHESSKAAN